MHCELKLSAGGGANMNSLQHKLAVRRLNVVVIVLSFLPTWNVPHSGHCENHSAKNTCRFKNLKLTQKEIDFVDRLAKEQEEFLDSVSILFALGQIVDTPKKVPKTGKELAFLLGKNSVETIAPDTFARAVKGLKQLSAKKAYEETTLFLIGKHPDFKGYRPKGDNYRFFKCLNKMYTKIAIGG